MKNIILLDLELTLIDNISSEYKPYSLITPNIIKIKQFIDTKENPYIMTFSWALWNENDIKQLTSNKKLIESELNYWFNDLLTIQDYQKLLLKYSNINLVDNLDFFDFYKNKEKTLFELCLHGWLKESDIYLIDDSVKNCKISIPDHSTNIEIINVYSL